MAGSAEDVQCSLELCVLVSSRGASRPVLSPGSTVPPARMRSRGSHFGGESSPPSSSELLIDRWKYGIVVTCVDQQTPLTSYATLNSLTLSSLISKKGIIAVTVVVTIVAWLFQVF